MKFSMNEGFIRRVFFIFHIKWFDITYVESFYSKISWLEA